MTLKKLWIPEGRAGTFQTLQHMRNLALQPSARLQEITHIIQDAQSVNTFIRSRWQIVPDPPDAEFVRSPDFQLQSLACTGHLEGDCDDSATLAGALLYTLGIPSWLIAIRMPMDTDFSHVFLRTFDEFGAIDIDPIVHVSQLPITGYAEKMELEV